MIDSKAVSELVTKQIINSYKLCYLMLQRRLLKLGMKDESKELGVTYLKTIAKLSTV